MGTEHWITAAILGAIAFLAYRQVKKGGGDASDSEVIRDHQVDNDDRD